MQAPRTQRHIISWISKSRTITRRSQAFAGDTRPHPNPTRRTFNNLARLIPHRYTIGVVLVVVLLTYLASIPGHIAVARDTQLMTDPILEIQPQVLCEPTPSPIGPIADQSEVEFGNFKVLQHRVPVERADAYIKEQLGSNWRIADWNELKEAWNQYEEEIKAAFETGIVLVTYNGNSNDGQNRPPFCPGDGGRLSGPRWYFVEDHDGVLPPGWLAHDNLGGHEVSLGSWYEGGWCCNWRALAYRETEEEITTRFAQTYAPILRMHSAETVFPSAVEVMIQNSELRDNEDDLVALQPRAISGPIFAGFHR